MSVAQLLREARHGRISELCFIIPMRKVVMRCSGVRQTSDYGTLARGLVQWLCDELERNQHGVPVTNERQFSCAGLIN